MEQKRKFSTLTSGELPFSLIVVSPADFGCSERGEPGGDEVLVISRLEGGGE